MEPHSTPVFSGCANAAPDYFRTAFSDEILRIPFDNAMTYTQDIRHSTSGPHT